MSKKHFKHFLLEVWDLQGEKEDHLQLWLQILFWNHSQDQKEVFFS